MTATANRPPARYGPGADLLGCVVVADDGEFVILRCPCDATLTLGRPDIRTAARRGFDVTCLGCAAGTKAEADRLAELARSEAAPVEGTACWSLLRAAYRAFGDAAFTFPQMVVAAYRADPRRWGLAGYEHLYPNANKVRVEMCLSKTRCRTFARFLTPVGPNVFRLNPAGLSAAVKMRDAGGGDGHEE